MKQDETECNRKKVTLVLKNFCEPNKSCHCERSVAIANFALPPCDCHARSSFRFVTSINQVVIVVEVFFLLLFLLLITMIFVEKVNTDRGGLFVPPGIEAYRAIQSSVSCLNKRQIEIRVPRLISKVLTCV